ncbi:hypothetical protein [Iodobacter ciconiae]|uniref:Uncharacterized protein n=1 Tax=Iodobacter ciconiae TaxID=2496266 RepID=A0A3S8ZQ05_9NEIS|nr:hypothetical protein [Iodobacter ciconiae]AZN35545.1 hypothetical protein EJO50_03005 [Iodobacter ciconiae]
MEKAALTHLIMLAIIAGTGGLVLNMVNLWEDSKKLKAERVPKDSLYWIFFVFWPLAGAGLVCLYTLDGSSLRPFLAFSVGLSAPATIQAMVSKVTANETIPMNSEP